MGRAWRTALTGALALAALGAAACSDDDADDDDEAVVITDEQYAAEVDRLCVQHANELDDEAADMLADGESDADIVAYLRVDLIPRTQAVMEGLVDFGLPPERAGEILTAFNEISVQLNRVNSDPYGFIDRTRNGDPSSEGTLETAGEYIDERLAIAEVPCLAGRI